MARGSLVVVGTGIKIANQCTIEARYQIETADIVYEVVGDQLVGVNADGVIQCDDDEIVGASFEVRAYTGSSVRLRIAERVAYAPPAPPSGAQPHVDTRWGYRMVLDVPAGTTTASLCSQAGADAVRAALGLPDKIVAPANVLHDLVIPLDGEVFGSGGRPLGPNGAPRQRQWLQLACVDSALAKRTLYRLTTDNVHRSRAALKMLTASYCGRRAWTLPGIEIAWEDGAPESLEARWGAARASCLGRPRLLERTASPESDLAQLPAELRDVCGGDGKQRCATAADWLTAVRSCVHDAPKKGLVPAAGESWPTFVRRLAAGAYEVEAPRALGPCSAACAGDDCPLEMIPSFVGAR